MRWQRMMFGLLWMLAVPAQAAVGDAAGVLARARAASGGEPWLSVQRLQAEGEQSVGGLQGRWQLNQDLRAGRYAEQAQLGTFTVAQGFDGKLSWRRDYGGEVGLLDGTVPRRTARTQAWLATRAYWSSAYPASRFAGPRTEVHDGQRYDVLSTTPEGADPIELWFDTRSGQLGRVIIASARTPTVTTLEDYRAVDGLLLPHRIVTDTLDAQGRADPRLRSDVQVQRYQVDGPVADTVYAPPVMAHDSYIEDASGTTRNPFDLINNHVYIEAEVDDQPVRFLVDTGAINLLTPTAAKRLGLTTTGRLSVHGAGDNASDLGLAQARHLRIGGAHLANPVFHIIDLGQQINSMGVPHDGFIGYETFLRFVTTFDYGARVLSFTRPGHYQPPANAVVLPFEQDDRAPVLNGELDGIPLRLWLDTGSRNSLSLSSPFVRTHRLLEKYHASEEAVLGWGLGGPGRARPARLGVLRMGDIKVTGLVGDLSSTDKGALALADYGAILGGGVLRRFSMGIDYDTKRLYLVPNAESTQTDAFDRSGLWLQAEDGALRVADVAPTSAGARAGLRRDDCIVMIAGEPIAARILGDWRTLLRERPVGTRVGIRYLRDGRQMDTELVLADRVAAGWPAD
ncbi:MULTISPECIES: aspartyl protease family protein [Stenotrophomonas]|uniref:aspartyl protease family protein n=1 Tax=Stenotrophomonas TaxID=40323 RepID=UPI000DB47859|nr:MULTISPECIES: aspartyl protease family protein [Stenotrophomonas]MBA0430197.1 PDZ domain-containing protein [Stenotrophomonas maltophilia]MDH0274719.1 aspartyl protease family protein [Stenotrophomonas sp. GD04089]MDH1911862.1 aspartyl protease family protein [Stenotrophomonas sp. GD03794]PZP88279.1 MAG: peptide-binding protein [Stenotrophomonas maltophilia]